MCAFVALLDTRTKTENNATDHTTVCPTSERDRRQPKRCRLFLISFSSCRRKREKVQWRQQRQPTSFGAITMISSIVWVPAGVADPNPKRYEMSAKELELLRLMEEQEQQNTSDKTKKIRGGLQVKPSESPAASLPTDLRMDEYSSDEDEGKELARIIGMQSGVLPPDDEEDDQDEDHDEGENRGNADMDSESDDNSDSSDDLADVPDTREFEPVDVEGLQAMGLNQIGNSAMHMDGLGEEDDDASEAENVRIADTDAIVLVAKTDEVSLGGMPIIS